MLECNFVRMPCLEIAGLHIIKKGREATFVLNRSFDRPPEKVS